MVLHEQCQPELCKDKVSSSTSVLVREETSRHIRSKNGGSLTGRSEKEEEVSLRKHPQYLHDKSQNCGHSFLYLALLPFCVTVWSRSHLESESSPNGSQHKGKRKEMQA